jgi:O-antigen biosynthesis protein
MNDLLRLHSALIKPHYLANPLSWAGHIPFAFWLVDMAQPNVLVELGTHTGNSYFSFCQSVKGHRLSTKCFAVDTWQGDEHSGCYGEDVFGAVSEHNQKQYSAFSTLMKMTFDDALEYFLNGTVDLLHIDGLHTYDSVKHDFDNWLPKLSEKGIVLFHDTNVRERKFGVWRIFEELSEIYPSISFDHSHGLGVLFIGRQQNDMIRSLIDEWQFPERRVFYKSFFSALADGNIFGFNSIQLDRHIQALNSDLNVKNTKIQEWQVREQSLTAQIQEWQAREQSLTAQIQEWQAREQSLTVQIQEWQAREQSLTAQIQEWQTREQSLMAQIQEWQTREQSLTAQIQKWQVREQRLIAQIHDGQVREQRLAEDYDRIVRSSSWKMTKPIRKLTKSIRKRSRKLRQSFIKTNEINEISKENVCINKQQSEIEHLINSWYEDNNKNKILVIDAFTPTPDQDSGSLDTFLTLRLLIELDYDVTFIPNDLEHRGKYTDDLIRIGVRCLNQTEIDSIERFIALAGKYFDLVIIYRVNIAAIHGNNVRRYAPQAIFIFNTVDLHFLREQRNAEIEKSQLLMEKAQQTKEDELGLMRSADASIVLSSAEFDIIQKIDPSINLFHVPFFRDIPGKTALFSERHDIVFIGGFSHKPNVDAIIYFVNKIWPAVSSVLTDVNLLIIGSNIPAEVQLLEVSEPHIKVIGYVKDLSIYLNRCKLTVAPLRIGAGIKGKIVTSAGYGVPCVATGIAAEGMGLTPDEEILVADDEIEFAQKVIKLYSDEKLWNKISDKALDFIQNHFSYPVGKDRVKLLLASILPKAGQEKYIRNDNKYGNISETIVSSVNNSSVDNRMRVIVELASFDKGGLEKVVLDSVLAFNKDRFLITIVTAGRIGHLGKIAKNNGVRIIQLPEIGAEAAYERFIRVYRPHISMSHFSSIGYPFFKEYSIPNVTFIHNVYAFLGEKERNLFRLNDKAVTHYIAVSNKSASYASVNFGIPRSKITVIPNGISINEHEERIKQPNTLTRSEFGLEETDYVFVNPASYNLHKGHYVMADALRSILPLRKDIKILCVGNEVNALHLKQLKDYIRDAGLAEHMLLPGYISSIEHVLSLSDACLMPSFIEGWSIAMNEAMFYEKPLILTDTGGASEVIENNDIGILIPNEYGQSDALTSENLDQLAYSPHHYNISAELVKAMLLFAENRDEWRRAGKLGREKIYCKYSFDVVVNQYELIMEKYAKKYASSINYA